MLRCVRFILHRNQQMGSVIIHRNHLICSFHTKQWSCGNLVNRVTATVEIKTLQQSIAKSNVIIVDKMYKAWAWAHFSRSVKAASFSCHF